MTVTTLWMGAFALQLMALGYYLGVRRSRQKMAELAKPAVPAAPPGPPSETYLRILKVGEQHRPGEGQQRFYDIKCLTCGGNLSRWMSDAKKYGIECNRCGSTASVAAIQRWMQHELRRAPEEACIYCFMGPEQHAGNKCLFESAEYTPRNRKEP